MHGDKSRVLVTRGISIIGPALVDAFLGRGAKVRTGLHSGMSTGPMNRVADNCQARRFLGREPQMKFRDGLRRTADWYFRAKKPEEAAAILDRMLTERMPSAVPLSKKVATAD
jgi:hypothetical protein